MASLSSASLTVGSTTFLGLDETQYALSDLESNTGEQAAVRSLWLTVTGRAQEPAISDLMRRFGLDRSPPAQQSPLGFLETAMATFRAPPLHEGAAAPALLAMRSAVEKTIDSLFDRKPEQERAGNWEKKVRAIARQAKLESISEVTIDSWVRDLYWLIDKLSSAKDKAVTREVCESRLRRAMIFLRELLEGLDPDMLRS